MLAHGLVAISVVVLAVAIDPVLVAIPRVSLRLTLSWNAWLFWLALRLAAWGLLIAAVSIVLFILYKLARLMYYIVAFSDPAAAIDHGCIPSDEGWDHR